MRIVYLSTFALLFGTLRAQEESSVESNDVESTTMEPRGFKFRPEVLRKFRIVLKRIFNFDRLFNTPPDQIFTFPDNTRRPFADNGQRGSQVSNSVRPNNDREFLEETAEVPDTSPRQPVYDPRRQYEQYWRDYYRQQQTQQYSPYGNQQYSPYGPQPNYNYQQRQQYSPYYNNQNYQYNQQSPYNPYYQQQQYGGQYGNQQGVTMGSGLNIGLPNGLGFNSGMGLNLGK